MTREEKIRKSEMAEFALERRLLDAEGEVRNIKRMLLIQQLFTKDLKNKETCPLPD